MWKLDPKYSQLTNPLEPLINFGGGFRCSNAIQRMDLSMSVDQLQKKVIINNNKQTKTIPPPRDLSLIYIFYLICRMCSQS